MLAKIPLFWSFYYFGWPKVLPINYTFSLTFNCNSRCRTCNIWRKKGVENLTFKQWHEVFSSLGTSPYWVTISGGEPFLRQDLPRVIRDLCQTCQPKVVTIPTNGLLTAKIALDVARILRDNLDTQFIINLSLDGIKNEHDQARGIKGNFALAMITLQKLKELKSPNLTVGIHTVISKNNVKNFPAICDYIFDCLGPDSFVTEIAEQRVELDNLGSNITPNLKDYQKAIGYLKMRMREQKQYSLARLTRAFRLSYYDLVLKILKAKTQVIPCYAGVASVQITANGDVWPCCVRADILGNVTQNDFKKIWFSKEACRIRGEIRAGKCACPLANAGYTNMLASPGTMIRVMVNFLR